MKISKLLAIGTLSAGMAWLVPPASPSLAQTCNAFGCSPSPAVACNAFGCPPSGAVAKCNAFGCPNPGAGECSAFGCPPSPPRRASNDRNPEVKNRELIYCVRRLRREGMSEMAAATAWSFE